MAKDGLIEFKESKKGDPPKITRIHRENKKLTDFEPVVTKVNKKEKEEEEKGDDDKWPKIKIEELFKPKGQIAKFYEGDKQDYYTKQQIHDIMTKYLTETKNIDKRHIKLDAITKPIFWEEKQQTEVIEAKEGEI
mmetsp:Transcript_19994/g.17063  ORF Transcript_19994/g.17063 Transcript_19994/m.17063 type:complete len:135 (+) Transcript_19994:1320-1724(+)